MVMATKGLFIREKGIPVSEKHFDNFKSEISPSYENNMKSNLTFI